MAVSALSAMLDLDPLLEQTTMHFINWAEQLQESPEAILAESNILLEILRNMNFRGYFLECYLLVKLSKVSLLVFLVY